MTASLANLQTEVLWRDLRGLCPRRPDLTARICAAADTEADPMFEDLPELLTLTEVAKLLRVSPRTIHGWIKDGTLPAVRLPGTRKVLIPRAGVVAALQPYPGDDKAADGD